MCFGLHRLEKLKRCKISLHFYFYKKKKKEKILGPVQRMAYPLVQTLCPRFPTGVENIEVEGGGEGGGGGLQSIHGGNMGGLKRCF